MNKFIIGSENGLIYIYDPKNNTNSSLKLNTSAKLKRIKAYDANHLLVITEDDGFFLTDGYQGEGIHYSTSNQLVSNQVYSLYDDDNQKHIWVAYKNTAIITRIDPFGTYRKHYQLKHRNIIIRNATYHKILTADCGYFPKMKPSIIMMRSQMNFFLFQSVEPTMSLSFQR